MYIITIKGDPILGFKIRTVWVLWTLDICIFSVGIQSRDEFLMGTLYICEVVRKKTSWYWFLQKKFMLNNIVCFYLNGLLNWQKL